VRHNWEVAGSGLLKIPSRYFLMLARFSRFSPLLCFFVFDESRFCDVSMMASAFELSLGTKLLLMAGL